MPKAIGSSPHTRGAHIPGRGFGPGLGIIPAYAGSTIGMSSKRSNRQGSSPHTRGAPDRGQARQPCDGIIPAYAGSTPTGNSRGRSSMDHPRIRGEHEGLGQWSRRDTGSSPHTRGAPARHDHRRTTERIIPAYAGSTSEAAPSCESREDHPRIRGEHEPLGDDDSMP